MLKSIIKKCLLSASILFSADAFAQLSLPNVFSDHMVLQRETKAHIWGWSYAGSTVKLTGSWSADTISVKTNGNGKWIAQLPTSQAGGPYTLTVLSGSEVRTLTDILLGDVYLCSGQSNMEWGGNQNLPEIMDELPHANNPNIRLMQVSRNGSHTPQDNIKERWNTLSAESLKPFSAIGYFIAQQINKEIGIPVGIINASWGGTPAEVWTPEELIKNEADLFAWSKEQGANDWRPNEPGVLYNAMIYPFHTLSLKAAFWYQGESNVGTWKGYDKLMKAMITGWRKSWNNDFPFYFVQIAPFTYNNKELPKAAFLREQQTKTALGLPNTGMVVVTDLVDNIQDIHPTQKRAVANRLTRMALKEIYNKPLKDYKSPIYKSQEIKGNQIEVSFHFLEGGLVLKGKELTDIYVAGEDKVFHPAKAKISKNKLMVSSSAVKNPVAVRFGFTEVAMPNLFNVHGLPVSPFRTDNWEI